jgi:hypothetical protein
MVKSSPINNIKTIRLTAGEDPVGDFGSINNMIDDIAKNMDPNNTRVLKSLYTPVRDASRRAYYSSSPIDS